MVVMDAQLNHVGILPHTRLRRKARQDILCRSSTSTPRRSYLSQKHLSDLGLKLCEATRPESPLIKAPAAQARSLPVPRADRHSAECCKYSTSGLCLDSRFGFCLGMSRAGKPRKRKTRTKRIFDVCLSGVLALAGTQAPGPHLRPGIGRG